MWLIVVGVLLIVFALGYWIIRGGAEKQHQTYKVISVVLWITAVALVFTVTVWGIFLAIVSAIAAHQIGKMDAYQNVVHGLKGKVEIKNEEMSLTTAEIRQQQIEKQTKADLDLADLQRETAKKLEHVRQTILDDARKKVLTPEAVSAVNEHKYRTEIDIDKRWKEIVQDLDAADLLEISEQQLIKKLTGYLAEQLRERHTIEIGKDAPQVKEALLARYDKNIAYLEAQIDARQTGLLLSENGQEAKRIGQGEADSEGYSEPEAEAVQEQVPAKRGRGRPRKDSAL